MLAMNHLIKRRLLYLVPVASTRLYFSNYDAPVKPPACTTVLRSRFGHLQGSSGYGHVHQVSARLSLLFDSLLIFTKRHT